VLEELSQRVSSSLFRQWDLFARFLLNDLEELLIVLLHLFFLLSRLLFGLRLLAFFFLIFLSLLFFFSFGRQTRESSRISLRCEDGRVAQDFFEFLYVGSSALLIVLFWLHVDLRFRFQIKFPQLGVIVYFLALVLKEIMSEETRLHVLVKELPQLQNQFILYHLQIQFPII